MAERQYRQDQDKVIIRLPDGMRDQIKAQAQASGRSMNAEIVHRLQTWTSAGVEVDTSQVDRAFALAQKAEAAADKVAEVCQRLLIKIGGVA